MRELFLYSALIVLSAFVSAVSQILLKKSAQKTYPNRKSEYLNPLVIIAYGMYFMCTFISMYALKVVPLSMFPILESTGYIFISVLGFLFIKEKLNKKQWLGMVLIIGGIVIYSLGL